MLKTNEQCTASISTRCHMICAVDLLSVGHSQSSVGERYYQPVDGLLWRPRKEGKEGRKGGKRREISRKEIFLKQDET